MPPPTVAVALPLDPPLQDGLVPEAETDIAAGFVSVTLAEAVQLFASVEVTV